MDAKSEGLSVAGYRPQSAEAVMLVNQNKELEERVLRHLDKMRHLTAIGSDRAPEVSSRFLEAGRMQIILAFMLINRAVFNPGRVALPEDVPSRTERAPDDPAGLAL